MLLHEISEEQFSVLSSALEEIKIQIYKIRTSDTPQIDPTITRLCDELESQFYSISEYIYLTSERNVACEDLPLQEFHKFSKLQEPANSISTHRTNLSMLLCPTLYLDHSISSSDNAAAIKILPYLLASYYINYPKNKIIPLEHTPQRYDLTAEDILFSFASDSKTLPPNYNKTLNSYCRKFSLEHRLPQFFRTKRTGYPKVVQMLNGLPELIKLLNRGITKRRSEKLFRFEMTSLHYQKVLEAYIYSLCVFACSSIEGLSKEIDYKLSIDLFNSHTLAFESIYSVGSKLCLKTFFEPKTYNAYFSFFDPEYKSSSPAKDLPTNFPFSLEFLKLSSSATEDELAQKAPLMLCIALHPSQYLAFRNEKILVDSLRNHISPVSKFVISFDLDDED